MKKVITYGTYDLLHYGHINLLKRAKALGDYLIVGITAEDFDRERGKINVHQSLMERVEAVRATGIADEIIIEEYEGQKIDDVRRYGVDVFTVGSDWKGKFDYLKKYCEVVYLDRTAGVSSSELRSVKSYRIGFVGNQPYIAKFIDESKYVNGLVASGVWTKHTETLPERLKKEAVNASYEEFLGDVDAVYIATSAEEHYELISAALKRGKHVLCESPIAVSKKECGELFALAKENGCKLTEAIKTAYSLAYCRLLLLAQTGKIGKIVSIETTCTSLVDETSRSAVGEIKSIYDWGPTAMLPVFQLLGSDYLDKEIIVAYFDEEKKIDAFTNVRFLYKDAVADVKVAKGVKSEGELIIAGTKGYIYVPAPWWKTEYFEIRYENSNDNQRFFYQLDGEGIRYELVSFVHGIETGQEFSRIGQNVSEAVVAVIEDFENGRNVKKIKFGGR